MSILRLEHPRKGWFAVEMFKAFICETRPVQAKTRQFGALVAQGCCLSVFKAGLPQERVGLQLKPSKKDTLKNKDTHKLSLAQRLQRAL